MPDREACLRAVRSRDVRFDGVFFNAVRSTGIYCRPSCPAVTPKDANMTFYPSAAAAVSAGYRACRRCRPDTSPGSPEWDARGDVVARAMRLIRDGVVDRTGVPGLAARLGYSERQLERLMYAELGAGPAALARAQRAYTARLLIESSDMSMADVAFAAGFSSIRSFNEAIAQVYATTPRALRQAQGTRKEGAQGTRKEGAQGTRKEGAQGTRKEGAGLILDQRASGVPGSPTAVVRVRLPRRDPFVVDSLFGHLIATAAPGVEEWRDGAYRTSLRLPNGSGIVALTPEPNHVAATLRLADPRDLAPAIARCRALLDLDADPEAIGSVLEADPALGPLWRAAPGRRIPRCIDAGEFALSAVLAQQVSVGRAAAAAGHLAAEFGDAIEDPDGGLTRLFPTPQAVAALDPQHLPMPRSRGRALVELAARLASGAIDLSPGTDREQARAQLAEVPGIGPWTVEVVALRGLGDPDAFPAGDLGVRHGLARLGLDPGSATRWRPWRAYAVQYLWAGDTTHPINRLPGRTDVTPAPLPATAPALPTAPPKQGADMNRTTPTYRHRRWESPIGTYLLVVDDEDRLAGVYLDGQRHLPFDAELGPRDDSVAGRAVEQLTEYFAGTRHEFDLELAPRGTDFQREVWEALRGIGYGETSTYGELARRIGRPAASRAVGAATGRNPWSIVVPCHRLVGGNGSLTGYAGGLAAKEHLLALESGLLALEAGLLSPASSGPEK